jgi:integrase
MSQIYAKLSDYVRKNGTRSIVIYSAESKDRSSPGIGYHVLTEDFDEETRLVKDTHPNYRNINSLIKKKVGEAESAKLESVATGKKFKPRKVKSSSVSFYNYCCSVTSAAKIEPGTLRNRNTQLKKIKAYDTTTKIGDINGAWMVMFQKYVEKHQKGESGWFLTYQFLIGIFKQAKKQKLNTMDVFSDIDIPKAPQTDKRKYLNHDEFTAFEEFTFSGLPENKYTCGLWQLYGSYSGLRFSDWKLHDIERYLEQGHIELEQTKTRRQVIIPLYPKLRFIMEKLVEHGRHKYTNIYHNKVIKAFGNGKPINRNISSHFGRHTFGVYLADHDVPPQVAQKLLGHKKIQMTMIYYEVTPRKVAETVARLLG